MAWNSSAAPAGASMALLMRWAVAAPPAIWPTTGMADTPISAAVCASAISVSVDFKASSSACASSWAASAKSCADKPPAIWPAFSTVVCSSAGSRLHKAFTLACAPCITAWRPSMNKVLACDREPVSPFTSPVWRPASTTGACWPAPR